MDKGTGCDAFNKKIIFNYKEKKQTQSPAYAHPNPNLCRRLDTFDDVVDTAVVTGAICSSTASLVLLLGGADAKLLDPQSFLK